MLKMGQLKVQSSSSLLRTIDNAKQSKLGLDVCIPLLGVDGLVDGWPNHDDGSRFWIRSILLLSLEEMPFGLVDGGIRFVWGVCGVCGGYGFENVEVCSRAGGFKDLDAPRLTSKLRCRFPKDEHAKTR